jgi:hypothetical protein
LIEGKGLGNKKVNRVGVSLSNRYDNKLKRLANACNMKHTTLAAYLIEKALDNIQQVNEIQNEFCTENAYRVIPIRNNGEIHYTLRGRYDL